MRPAAEDASPVSLGALASLVGYHIAQARLVSNRAFERHVGGRFELRRVEFSLLVLLDTNGPLSPKDLVRVLSLSAPNLTLLLDRMQQRGLVQRERHPRDGRSQLIVITDAGRTTAVAAASAAHQMELDLQVAMTPAEHAMLIELLGKFAGQARD